MTPKSMRCGGQRSAHSAARKHSPIKLKFTRKQWTDATAGHHVNVHETLDTSDNKIKHCRSITAGVDNDPILPVVPDIELCDNDNERHLQPANPLRLDKTKMPKVSNQQKRQNNVNANCNKVKRFKWNETDMADAVRAATSDGISMRQAAQMCNVPHSTLHKIMKGKTQIGKRPGRKPLTGNKAG